MVIMLALCIQPTLYTGYTDIESQTYCMRDLLFSPGPTFNVCNYRNFSMEFFFPEMLINSKLKTAHSTV